MVCFSMYLEIKNIDLSTNVPSYLSYHGYKLLRLNVEYTRPFQEDGHIPKDYEASFASAIINGLSKEEIKKFLLDKNIEGIRDCRLNSVTVSPTSEIHKDIGMPIYLMEIQIYFREAKPLDSDVEKITSSISVSAAKDAILSGLMAKS